MSPPPPWSERLVPIGQEIARLQIPPSCASLISSHSALILPTQVSITLFNISSFYRHGHLVRKLILRGYSTRRKGRTTEGWAPGIRCVLGRYDEVPGGNPAVKRLVVGQIGDCRRIARDSYELAACGKTRFIHKPQVKYYVWHCCHNNRRMLKKAAVLTLPALTDTSPSRPESAKTASSPRDAPFPKQGRSF